MHSKLTSRKFWIAVITGVVGIVTAIWGASAGQTVETIAGAAMTVAIALGYIIVEGEIDKAKKE